MRMYRRYGDITWESSEATNRGRRGPSASRAPAVLAGNNGKRSAVRGGAASLPVDPFAWRATARDHRATKTIEHILAELDVVGQGRRGCHA